MMNKSAAQVAVVVPVYKTQLTAYERIALTQCVRILGSYPIILVAPHGLSISEYREICPTLTVRTFDKHYFASIQGYNQLMLAEEFYQAFTDFTYMLIHQLDAFVFQDELAEWCQRGYDYIGAPWLRDRDFTNWGDATWFRTKQFIATLLNLKKPDGITPREIISLNAVGNGGLSLRRVATMITSLRRFRSRLNEYHQNHQDQYNEDVFWGIEVNRYWPFLRIPSYRTALRFAVEFYPQRAIETYNKGKLPFGCHAWDIHGTDYWRPIFARYGYQI
ncbi:DUF5672 family protein [Spirosoma montaniterrae]|uniref:DUF5672 domain-containing protein n=1 Tax=Spirosoma montaniterrae TaxID=1178516 RepID=A0A1P9WWA9_9BACT|nr:DUF5672 family protein [Spirosoma montaniterrae]AQG79664.1 hypothetical protein AWR27_10185 [Spirosoma montaniterrae]